MRRIWRWITANWALKLASLLIATLFWISYNAEPNAEVAMAVPLEFRSIPHGLEISGDVPGQAIVRLRGRATLLRHLAPGDVSASLDMSRTTEGDASFAMQPADVSVPYGVRVVLINPSEVHVKLIPRQTTGTPR